MATSGPGATNLVTGIATAYMDSSPIVAITGQVPTAAIGRDAFQEADIIGITTPITKYNIQVRCAEDIPKVVKEAFYIATSGRPGPVLIDLPRDVQMEEADMDFDVKLKIRGYKPTYEPHPLQVKKAADLLVQAERPMILAGGGVIVSGAEEELRKVAELLLAPVATPLMGKGCFPENHPLSLGTVGMHGTIEANKLILEADVLLAVGTRFSDRTTGKLEAFCPDAKIIHIDVDTAEIGKNAKVDLPLVADAKRALGAIHEELVKRVRRRSSTPWLKRVKELKEEAQRLMKREEDFRPSVVLKELRKSLPENAIITTGVGRNQMWAALHFKVIKPRTFISSGGLGTMGFGFPAALGAKVAKPDNIVVDVDGDGSFLMTEQDLATSITENIPVVVVILNDGWLGMVRYWQALFYGKRYMATNLRRGCPDFVKLAKAFGAQGFRAEDLDEFRRAVKSALSSDVTTVIDTIISPDEPVLPFVPPGKALREVIWET
jgi:acetolactate synthase-1/2/3 large subunit